MSFCAQASSKLWARKISPAAMANLDHGAGMLRVGEVDAIVGEHCVYLVRHCGDEMAKEVASDPGRGLLVHLDEGELRGTVDGYQQVESAFFGPDLGNVDVEIADRIALELTPGGRIALDHGQLRDAMALQGSGAVTSGSGVGCSPAGHRGRRPAAAMCDDGKRRSPLPPRSAARWIWRSWDQSAYRWWRSAASTWQRSTG